MRPAASLIAVSAVWGVFWGVWGGQLPAVQERIGGTVADLGLALVAIPIGAIPAMLFAGRLARRREKLLLGISVVAFAAAVAALAVPTTSGQLAAALAVVGMTSGALDVCLNMAVARTGKRPYQSVHAAFPVAVVVSAPVAGLARQLGAGVVAILLVTAVLVFLLGGAAALLVTLGDQLEPEVPPTGGVRRAGLWLGLLGACLLIVENGVEQWSAVLLEDYRHATPVIASSGLAVYYLALTAGRLIAQGRSGVSLRPVMAIGAIGGGIGVALAATVSSAAASLVCFALAGLAFGPVIPAMLEYAAGRDTDGSLVARVTTISYGGFVASPLLVSLLHQWWSLPVAFACLGLLTVPLLVAGGLWRSLKIRS